MAGIKVSVASVQVDVTYATSVSSRVAVFVHKEGSELLAACFASFTLERMLHEETLVAALLCGGADCFDLFA